MVVYKKKISFSEEIGSQLFSQLISAGNSTHHTYQQARKNMTMAIGTQIFIKNLFLKNLTHGSKHKIVFRSATS